MKNQSVQIVKSLQEATIKGCSFMSFLYTSKGKQETALYNINFGISYENACEHDKLALESYIPKDDLEVQAKTEILKSLTETLTEGVSQAYTNKDVYIPVCKGVKQKEDTGELYIYGFVNSKTVVEEAKIVKKPVNSRPLTIAKAKIGKELGFKRDKFAQFILNPEHIGGILVKGNVIEVQGM